jgi:uncharacterized SAM-binding protein YcdF (DUF218 family)
MFFVLKKTLGWLANPLNLTLLLLVVSAFFFWQRRWAWGRRRVAVPCLAFAAALFAFFGNGGVCALLITSLESDYPAVPELVEGAPLPPALADCKYVLVLGAGAAYHPERSSLERLSAFSLQRLAEGIRILRCLPPDAKLLVCGWDGGSAREGVLPMAREYERAAVSLGVAGERIVRFEHARDTREEISAAKERAAGAKIAVVTTAFHMPRAMALCAEAGVAATACPTNFSTWEIRTSDFFRWSIGSLGISGYWVHEVLGRMFA